MTLQKAQLIDLLKSHGFTETTALESPEISEKDLILAIHRNGYAVAEGFFRSLAKELGLPYVSREQLVGESILAVALPYSILEENLVVPLEISADKVKLATANPLNTDFFEQLAGTFHAKVELSVASIGDIEATIGAGYEELHKYRALGDLRYRSPDESAYRVLYPWQRYFIIGLSLAMAVLFMVNYPLSFIILFAAINILYFCVNPIKFYISFRGFQGSRRSVLVSEDDVRNVDERNLPVYTILIPIFRESQILPHIVENIYKLDYPRDKLDVKILMEEKDEETISEARRLGLFGKPETTTAPITLLRYAEQEQMTYASSAEVIDSGASTIGILESVSKEKGLEPILTVRQKNGTTIQIPESLVKSSGDVVVLKEELDGLMKRYVQALGIFDAVVVPTAEITTKPRACNYGLFRAKGEYCVIYDAEDDPEPDQLKKAAIAFSRAHEDVVCLQSRLNFYNPKENLLTRWFSLEYSFWYDYYLDGLDQVGAPLPLGGTSNHFKVKQLRELGGWDPYNVTEDADLGVRISRRRLKTAMLNSYTFEEANKKLPNWVRQRSRWSKGYVQTYLVHMRHPRRLVREMGWKQFLYFQLTFGGNIFLPLVNPLLWAVTLLTIVSPGIFDFLFFYPIVYVCIFNLIVGNGVYMILHMGPYVLKKHYTSIPLAIVIPLYWVLISIGDWRGILQVVTKPFYWEKTEHGLTHLYAKGQT